MKDINIGFIGLGNLGKNLANSILEAGYNVYINDLIQKNGNTLIKKGAIWCDKIYELVNNSSIIFTCLPNLKAISLVIESKQGIINFINSNHLIIECSTTDEADSLRLSKLIESKSANYLEAPLTGGEWRSKNGNISVPIYANVNGDTAKYILNHSESELLFVGKLEKSDWDDIKSNIPKKMCNLIKYDHMKTRI